MTINEILIPCPFCGREVKIASIDCTMGTIASLEVCCICGAEVRIRSDDLIYSQDGRWYQPGLTAVEKWNRRAGDKSPAEDCPWR